MKYVYFELRMLHLEVSLILAFILYGGAVDITLSMGPHLFGSIGSVVNRMGIDKVMYFPTYFILYLWLKIHKAICLYI